MKKRTLALQKKHWIYIAVGNGVSIVPSLAAAHFAWGWPSAWAIVISQILMLGAFCFRYRDALIARFFLFGIALGITELANDAWLIHTRHLLVYPLGGPFVGPTPLYMPFCWALSFVTTASIAVWLRQKWGPLKGALALAVLGVFYIPGFEAIADRAQWWHYQNTPLYLGLAPRFVVLAEAVLVIPMIAIGPQLLKSSLKKVIALGVVEGLVIWAATAVALRITD